MLALGRPWVTYDSVFGAFSGALDKLVVDSFLNKKSRAGTAALTHVEEKGKVCLFNSIVNIGVVENDAWRFAAEFEGNFFQV